MSGFHPFQHLPTKGGPALPIQNCRFSCNKYMLHSLRELSRLLIRSRLMKSFQREHIDIRVHPRLQVMPLTERRSRAAGSPVTFCTALHTGSTPARTYRSNSRTNVPYTLGCTKSFGGICRIGNDAGRIVLQNCRNILLGGNKIDHAHRAPLVGKQIKRAVKGVFLLHGGNFRNRPYPRKFCFPAS